VPCCAQLVSRSQAPGAIVGVSVRGGPATITASGDDPHTHVALRADDEFRIASITKTFVGALALQLVQQGRLALDDAVTDHVPDWPRGSEITVRMLLSHTSGIPPLGGDTGSQDAYSEASTKFSLDHYGKNVSPDEVLAFRRGAGWSEEQIAHAAASGWAGFRRIVTPIPLSYQRLVDGGSLTIGGNLWRVVVGSGHSPEHACLLNEAAGILIAGDQVLPRISPNVSLGITEPAADPLGEWFASIAKLRQLPHNLLVLPGHGDPFTGLHNRLDAMDREHRDRLDELEAFLAEPRRATDCFGRLFRRAIGPEMLGMATGEALAHLRRLEVEGRAVKEAVDGVWWYRAS